MTKILANAPPVSADLKELFDLPPCDLISVPGPSPLSVKLLRNGTLKVYEKYPHGMCVTHAEVVNADLLAYFSK